MSRSVPHPYTRAVTRARQPASAVVGHMAVPGDKSVSHRSVLVAAVADGECRHPRLRPLGRHLGDGRGGARARRPGRRGRPDELVVHGVGLGGLRPPDGPIDCANSGTLMRLLAGLLAGNGGRFELTGRRLAQLAADGADRRAAAPDGRRRSRRRTATPPLVIEGGALRAITYELPVASAQVKSAILLAGLGADGPTTRRRASADARPHRADAPRRRRRASTGAASGSPSSRPSG